jgi:ABC-type spermidine/putrescine transport system permease subunit II
MHTPAIVVPLSCLQQLARTGQRQEAAGVQANRPQAAVERLGNFQELFEDRGFRISLCNAPVYVGDVSIVAPASVAGALALALMIEAAPRGRALFRAMFFLPVALGLILAYGAVDDLRATWLFIQAGHVVFCLPFMVRAVLAVLLALDLKGLEEAARPAAPPGRSASRACSCPTSAVASCGQSDGPHPSLGKFHMTLLLHTPFTRTLPVDLADAHTALWTQMASAYTLIFFVLILPLLRRCYGPRAGWSAARDRRHHPRELRQDLDRRDGGAAPAGLRGCGRRDTGAARALRLRQDHAAAPDRQAGEAAAAALASEQQAASCGASPAYAKPNSRTTLWSKAIGA